jgi:integrase
MGSFLMSKVRYLIERGGRFHARLVVPKHLRAKVHKVELSVPLGADRTVALRRLPAAVASLQDQIDRARADTAPPPRSPPLRPRPLDPEEMARTHYAQSIAFDTEARNSDPRFAAGFVDAAAVSQLRTIIAGSATDGEIVDALGPIIEYFRGRRNHSFPPGSPEWRGLARVLARAELESLRVTAARDDGDDDPVPPAFLDAAVQGGAPPAPERPSITELFDAYRLELQKAGKARDADARWRPVLRNLIGFLGHERSERVTRADALRWKEYLLKTFAPRTVRDFYFSTARAVFSWALDNDQASLNPFSHIKVIVAKRPLAREKGFNDGEALAVLKAARAYVPPTAREQPPMIAAKRWTPLLAAYTGARIAELTQLRAEDVQSRDGIFYLRLTPEAGTIKSGIFRDVPLHSHLISLGFLDFVATVKAGPLFYRDTDRKGRALPARTVAERIGKWIRSLKIAADSVQPNHGWRHRLKTQGRELGLDPVVIDAIQGHAPRTAGENYGDVSLKAKTAAIAKLPSYAL